MSTSAAHHTVKRAKRVPLRQHFRDGLDERTFRRLVVRRHREFFEKRGIDPDSAGTGGFEASSVRTKRRTSKQ